MLDRLLVGRTPFSRSSPRRRGAVFCRLTRWSRISGMTRVLTLLTFLFFASSVAFAQAPVGPGKYGCVASKFQNGEFTVVPRGSLVLATDGGYTYYGFEEPSRGTYRRDGSGRLAFRGGYLDGGEGEPTDRPGQFLLTFPVCPDSRWTCSLVEE